MSALDLKKGATFLGLYRIDRLLGRGGMGEVWQAYDLRLKRAVAIKVTLRDVAAEPGDVERFERETQVVAQFKHPNICRVYAAGLIPDKVPLQLYMVMELVDGQSLALMLRIVKRLDETSACYYASQLLEALHEAHEKKIIHRDVKPENVIVGKDGHVTVIDFGIAKGRGTSREVGSKTGGPARITNRIGTPRYMSPEQIEGGEVDRRSDLYSVGVLLYLMLSGDFPYPGIDDDDETAILMAHLVAAPHPLLMVVPDCSEELSAIVLRLLEKDPDDRYQSAEEAAIDLSAYVRGSIDPVHPLAKKMAADRRSIAHRAVYEHGQSLRPPAPARPQEAAQPQGTAARTGLAPGAPDVSSSTSGRSWANKRPSRRPGRLSLVVRDTLHATAIGCTLGALAWGGIRMGKNLARSIAVAASADARVAPAASATGAASTATAAQATATATAAGTATVTAASAARVVTAMTSAAPAVASATVMASAAPAVARVAPTVASAAPMVASRIAVTRSAPAPVAQPPARKTADPLPAPPGGERMEPERAASTPAPAPAPSASGRKKPLRFEVEE